jgi:hypothetical protein
MTDLFGEDLPTPPPREPEAVPVLGGIRYTHVEPERPCDCGTEGCCSFCKGTTIDPWDGLECFDCDGTGHERRAGR